MTFTEALDIVVGRTNHERYRWLCSDANPDAAQRDAYRRSVIRQASGERLDEPLPRVWENLPPAPIQSPDHPRGGCCGH